LSRRSNAKTEAYGAAGPERSFLSAVFFRDLNRMGGDEIIFNREIR
jgi:hypothetical protein